MSNNETKMEVEKADETVETVGTVKIDEEYANWTEVQALHKDMEEQIVDLQMMVFTMCKANEAKIDNDKELYTLTIGLMKTISDLTEEIMTIKGTYNGKDGQVAKDDDETKLYIQSMASYADVGEKFAVLASTAVTDILVRINADDDLIKQAVQTQNDIVTGNVQIEGEENGKQ